MENRRTIGDSPVGSGGGRRGASNLPIDRIAKKLDQDFAISNEVVEKEFSDTFIIPFSLLKGGISSTRNVPKNGETNSSNSKYVSTNK
jgi:hypothetical protein